MADSNDQKFTLFGFEIKRAKKEENKNLVSPVPPTDEDGTGLHTVGGSHFSQVINLDGDNSKDNIELIMRYRGISMQPEVDDAIEEIVNESISASELRSSVELSIEDDVEGMSESIKERFREEFKSITKMLNFNNNGHDLFRTWYIDGRIVHFLVVDEKNPKAGIQDIRHIDSTKIQKKREVKFKKDQRTGMDVVDKVNEYYVYDSKDKRARSGIIGAQNSNGGKIATDSISYVTSGLLDEQKKKVVSYLHKSLKAVNNLRMMEDALVIYRLSRAPERRIFYIDVGNMSKGKAEEYMRGIMAKYRNKLVYDASTGQIKDDRRHMSMLEDFWLPRKEGGRGTEITTLPGGQNLGQIDDIVYFQKKLYKSLNVPQDRLEAESTFSIGRSAEITREEIKFQKFVDRLRRRFGAVFLGILKKQLLLKGIITAEDWDKWKDEIHVNYIRDNHFSELKEAEIIRDRFALLNEVQPFVGEYISKKWVKKNVLRLTDEDIEDTEKQIDQEIRDGEVRDPMEIDMSGNNNPFGNKKEEPREREEPKPEPKPKPKDSDENDSIKKES